MKKRKYILTPILLLALFLGYQASITFFAHVHIVNGVMIVHSHPSSDKHHTHTVGQVITIAHLSSVQTLEGENLCSAQVMLPVLYVLKHKNDTSRLIALHTQGIHLRAPPCKDC